MVEMNVIAIGEGYATVATGREAMGWAGVVAVDAGNLPAVARVIRANYPDAKLVMVGDDDTGTAGNPGRTKAEAAAAEVGALVAFPMLADGSVGDWNDLRVAEGLGAVVRQLEWVETAEAPSPVAVVADLPPAPSEVEPAAETGTTTTGGAGEELTSEQVLRRYALVEGTTNVWDIDKSLVMKKTAFEARVGKPLAKVWLDDTEKKLIGADQVREIEQARRMAGKKGGALGMAPIERYVYIDGTKDVWDREKKRRIPEGALKIALGDAYALWLNASDRGVVDVDHIVFDHRQLTALLPPGPAWELERKPELAATLQALAPELARIDARALDLLGEMMPATVLNLVPDWERVMGLPDPCLGGDPAFEDRRIAVQGRLVDVGSQRPAFFVEMAISQGYPEAKVVQHRAPRTALRPRALRAQSLRHLDGPVHVDAVHRPAQAPRPAFRRDLFWRALRRQPGVGPRLHGAPRCAAVGAGIYQV